MGRTRNITQAKLKKVDRNLGKHFFKLGTCLGNFLIKARPKTKLVGVFQVTLSKLSIDEQIFGKTLVKDVNI